MVFLTRLSQSLNLSDLREYRSTKAMLLLPLVIEAPIGGMAGPKRLLLVKLKEITGW